jgi:hypothetical protein
MLTELAQAAQAAQDGPKITNWITIGIAVFALIAASTSALSSRQANRRQEGQLEAARDQDRRRQASQIAAWSELRFEDAESGGGTRGFDVGFAVNASRIPVFDVVVSTPRGTQVEMPTLPPADGARVFAKHPAKDGIHELSPGSSKAKVLVIHFTDAEGNRWRRDANGLRLTRPAPPVEPDPPKKDGSLRQLVTRRRTRRS